MSTTTEEIWKPVVDWEGHYAVSNLGRVISVARKITYKGQKIRNVKTRVLKARKTPEGYWQVCLYRGGKRHWLYVHRLVAEAFLPREEGCDIVNHIDNDPDNCRAENLEWTTQLGNIRHAIKQGRRMGRAVQSSGGRHYEIMNMAKADGFDPSGICQVARGHRKTYKGETWWYVNGLGDGIHGDLF